MAEVTLKFQGETEVEIIFECAVTGAGITGANAIN